MFDQNWWRRKSCQFTVYPKHNTLQPSSPKKQTNKNKQNQRKINHYKSKTKQYEKNQPPKQTNKQTKQQNKTKQKTQAYIAVKNLRWKKDDTYRHLVWGLA